MKLKQIVDRKKSYFRAFFKNNVIHPIKGCEGMSFTSLGMSLGTSVGR